MPIDLTPLRNSLNSLTESLHLCDSRLAEGNLAVGEHSSLRAGAIKHFEIAYELSWKMMQRWLNTNVGPEAADPLTRHGLFRLSCEKRLISDVGAWIGHNKARNQTAHIYDEMITIAVYEGISAFIEDARELLGSLEVRND
ncbi:MAG: HI0074 family nucleotidyltransferase substrate-binding subunit [bacterium]|nr:HI0074 family nucleotidyltransferase substrate-binding subunit [bacterium]